ncbi:type II toxin-antitoxin system HicB family antitoxin [Candidatus Aerophobetes bacterium]|nr:type II toxin-antitoxin system HicB family antitoxin [Candidatus Aerophobetes bacterium]
MRFRLQIIVEPDVDEFHAYCPALKGLHVPGKTVEEAIKNAKEAALLHLQSLVEDGKPIPIGIETGKPRLSSFHHKRKSSIEELALAV